MKLIDRDKVEIPHDRSIVKGGMLYVPIADVEKGLDASRVIFNERDPAAIVEALGRQVKKEPLRNVMLDYDCPTCKAPLEDYFPHCPECGQALLWSGAERRALR